jgi:microcystin-dependent protein
MPDIKEINSGVFLEQPQEKAYNLLPNNSVSANTLAPDVIALISSLGSPIGSISAFAGASAPNGYLICDGTTKLRSSYAALFAAIGTVWNTGGELGTEFRLPNGQGRTFIGAGTYTDSVSGSVTRTLAGYVGTEKHVLSANEGPSHTHVQSPHTHGVTDPGHFHTTALPSPAVYNAISLSTTGDGGSTTSYNTNSKVTGLTVNGATAVNLDAGADFPHNNMQPSFVGNWIIKF